MRFLCKKAKGVFEILRIVLQFNGVCTNATMPSAIVLLAEGAEEMEAIISVDVLRRGGVRFKFFVIVLF